MNGSGRRSLWEIISDASGQLTTEWALLTATVIVPIGLLDGAAVTLLDAYFYRIAGVITLPFP